LIEGARAGREVPDRRRLVWAMVLAAAIAALAAAAGIPVRALFSAQVAGDEPEYLITTLSLTEDRSLDVSDEYAAGRYRSFHEAPARPHGRTQADGRLLVPHEPLLPVLLAVPLRLGGWVGAKLALAALAAVLSAVMVWTAVRRLRAPPLAALVTVGVFGASAPLAVYGSQVYPELPAGLAIVVAVAAFTGPLRAPGLALLGAAVVALPWMGSKYVLFAFVLVLAGVLRLVRRGSYGQAAALAGALGVAAAGFLGLHRLWYDGWTAYAAGGQPQGAERAILGGGDLELLGRSPRLAGLLLDRTFGLGVWQPAWIMAIPAVAALLSARPRGWTALALPVAAGWLGGAFLAVTMAGWWWPGRHIVAGLPVLALAIAWWAGRGRARLWLLGGLGAVGISSHIWMLMEGWELKITWVVNFTKTSNPFYRTWRLALPDYLESSPESWVLHGLWIALAGGLAVWGWQSRPTGTSAPAQTGALPAPSGEVYG
jgi:hypothetical protein